MLIGLKKTDKVIFPPCQHSNIPETSLVTYATLLSPASTSRKLFSPASRFSMISSAIPAKLDAALSTTAGNAQEVADAVLKIIETPAGEKQLRYFVSLASLGLDEINALSHRVQTNLLEAFGLTADTKFRKGNAVGSV